MPADVVRGKLYPAEAGEQAGERELDLRARECGADAEVWADAELKVPVRRAADVKAVRFWELPGVPTRGPDGEPEGVTCSHLGSVNDEIIAGGDAARLDRSVVAKNLLDGRADEPRVVAECTGLPRNSWYVGYGLAKNSGVKKRLTSRPL